jgi:hypothetical protein
VAEYATLRCPVCKRESQEVMPEDACVHFYECPRLPHGVASAGRRVLRLLLLRGHGMPAAPAGDRHCLTH